MSYSCVIFAAHKIREGWTYMMESIKAYVMAVWKTTNAPRAKSCEGMNGGIASRDNLMVVGSCVVVSPCSARRLVSETSATPPSFSSSSEDVRDLSRNCTNRREVTMRAL
jgi:hypothetical protein